MSSPRGALVLVVPAEHPLAARGEVALAEVSGERFIDYPLGYADRTANDRAYVAAA